MTGGSLFHYALSRLMWLVPTLLAMALVTFLVMHATPGSPLDPVAEGANPLSPEAQKVLAKHYGLDRPLYEQFAIFVSKAVRGDFGYSFVYKTRTVQEIIAETFPISLLLGSMALVLAIVVGLTLGIMAALYQNRTWDYISVSLATVGVAVPNFVLAVFLIILFSFILPLFPTGGWDSPRNWVLPTVALALAPMGIIARFTRASMLEVIRADYTLTARAKGLGEVPVIFKHALKNAFIPVVTLLGPMFAAVGTGSFFVESIFRVPGMGRFFVLSMTGRDYPMIMAVVLTYGAFLAIMNLVVDLLYGVLDPRIRSSSLWRDGVRRLRRNRLAVAGGAVIALLCFIAIFADFLAPLPYTKSNFGRLNEAPSRDYPLGTDQLGRDLLSRMIYGARVSMLVGLGAQVIVVLIGVPIGALSGYLGGRTDMFLTRFIDVMYAFPRLLFVILVMSALGAGLMNIFIAIGLTGWVGIARQTRAQVLAINEKEFVDGARALGAGFGRVLGRHVMPNALTPIIVAVTFGIPEAIFTEAALSFIGVGINPPTPSWGQMVGEGQQYIRSYWHLCVFPSIAIAVTMLSFVFFGDGVRDALDPKLK